MAGDHNCVVNPIDIENGIGYNNKKCIALENLIKVAKLIDVFRYINPNVSEYTFFRSGSAPSRLDRIYISNSYLNNIENVQGVSKKIGISETIRYIHNRLYLRPSV